MDLGFLRMGWAQFGLDISIRLIPLPFEPNNYSNTIWAQKFISSVNTCPPHSIWPMGHVCMKSFYMSKTFICQILSSLFSNHFTIRPEVQITPLDVDYQREERAKT